MGRAVKHALWLFILLGMVGCEHAVGVNPPEISASCYDGAFTSFCVVSVPMGTTAVTGSGVVPAIGQVVSGVGNLMIGQGTIASGVGSIVNVVK
jgi:hypothetical protein